LPLYPSYVRQGGRRGVIAASNKNPAIPARKFYFCRGTNGALESALFNESPYETSPSARHAPNWARELLINACDAVCYANKTGHRRSKYWRQGSGNINNDLNGIRIMRFVNPMPVWSANRSLLAGATVFYVALVVILVYTIISLLRSEEWPDPTSHHTSAALRTIALSDAAAYPWIQRADLRLCNAENWLDANQAPVTRGHAHRIHAARVAMANLVWAPPGTAIAYDDAQRNATTGEMNAEGVASIPRMMAAAYTPLAAR
jgi:hypothetical protein